MNKHNARSFNSTPLLLLKNFYFLFIVPLTMLEKPVFVNYWTKKVINTKRLKVNKKGLILHDLNYFDRNFQAFYTLKIKVNCLKSGTLS